MDILTDTFGNLFTDIFFGIFILIGILLGIFLRPMFGNMVLKLHLKDHRMDELDISEETAISVECKPKKGLATQRFFKWQPGFTGISGRFLKKPKTIYLGVEGTAYTQKVKGGQLKIKLSEAVQTLWGTAFYETIPDKQKKILEADIVPVTITIDEVQTPDGMKAISEEDIKSEQDRKAAETLWEGKDKEKKGQYINLFLAGGTGAAIVFAAFMLGLLKIPTVEVPVPVNGTSTTAAIATIAYHFGRSLT